MAGTKIGNSSLQNGKRPGNISLGDRFRWIVTNAVGATQKQHADWAQIRHGHRIVTCTAR